MEAVACPYCDEENHTSNPGVMAACAYCGKRFAQASTDYQKLVIIDRQLDNAWYIAEDLMSKWQNAGELEKEAIVDRRIGLGEYRGAERRMLPSPVSAANG